MSNYSMISDYFANDQYRASFNQLSINTFHLDFEEWHQKELFQSRYICYSYIDQDKVIANASINHMDLVVEGQRKKAIQIGTVMTQPEYRKQGLSAALINHIIEKYERVVDLIYLFANDSVLDFYPKFGFKKGFERTYEFNVKQLQRKEVLIEHLKTDKEEDCKTIMTLGTNRQPISQKLGVFHDNWPLLVYCFYEYKDDLYYVADEDAVVIIRRDQGALHLYDVLSLKPIELDSIIEKIVVPEDEKIEFHFIPELYRYSVFSAAKRWGGETLFVRTNSTPMNEVLFPRTSHT